MWNLGRDGPLSCRTTIFDKLILIREERITIQPRHARRGRPNPVRTLTRSALIAATYATVTVVLTPLSYGFIQIRVSEALTLLPFLWGPWAAVGLWVGCMIANAWGGFGPIDVVGGCLLTLGAGLLSARMPNVWLAALWPILLNAFGVAGILAYVAQFPYWPAVGFVGLGQAVAVGGIGIPLTRWLLRLGWKERGYL